MENNNRSQIASSIAPLSDSDSDGVVQRPNPGDSDPIEVKDGDNTTIRNNLDETGSVEQKEESVRNTVFASYDKENSSNTSYEETTSMAQLSVDEMNARTQSLMRSVGNVLQNSSVSHVNEAKEDKSRKLKSRLMHKLQQKRQVKNSSIKTMTVEELHAQNERMKPLIDKLNREEESSMEIEVNRKKEPSSPPLQRKKQPLETAQQFLRSEGTARVFTVPKLTATNNDSSDDEIRVVDGGDEATSSLNTFKSSVPDIRFHPATVDFTTAEESYKEGVRVNKALRAKLERSNSSIRREDRDFRNLLDLRAQIESTEEARKEKELNDRFNELYNQKKEEEEEEREVIFDEEETVIKDDDSTHKPTIRALSESEEEWSDSEENKEKEKEGEENTELPKDETPKDESTDHTPPVEVPKTDELPVKQTPDIISKKDSSSVTSNLLSLGKDGKLRQAKPASNLLDLFSRAKSKTSKKQIQADESKKQDEKEEAESGDSKKLSDAIEPTQPVDPTLSTEPTEHMDLSEPSSPSVDENEYKEGEQPTEADYARYRQMMREPKSVKNDLFDSEAEESGSEVEGGDSVDSETPMVVPEGIDITERPLTESEQLDVMHLHNQIKEQADQQQLEYVKKGVREGARYMHRQMQRNQVPYDAFSDEEDNRKRTIVAAMGDEEESEEENEEEEYLRQIRKERILKEMMGKNGVSDEEEEEEEEEEESEEDKGNDFSPEEKKEMEEFVQRVDKERRLQKSLSSRHSFKNVVTFDNPELSTFLQSSSSVSSQGNSLPVTTLNRSTSISSYRSNISKVPSVLTNTAISSISRSNSHSNQTKVQMKTSFLFTSSSSDTKRGEVLKDGSTSSNSVLRKRSSTVRVDQLSRDGSKHSRFN